MNMMDIYTTVERYVKQFVKGEGRVSSKIISDITCGILISKSVKLSEIVRGVYKIPQRTQGFSYICLGTDYRKCLKSLVIWIKQLLGKEKKVNKNQLTFNFAEDL